MNFTILTISEPNREATEWLEFHKLHSEGACRDEGLREWYEWPDLVRRIYVAMNGNQPIGVVAVGNDYRYTVQLYVLGKHRHQGVGDGLLTHLLRDMPDDWHGKLHGYYNYNSVNLYTRHQIRPIFLEWREGIAAAQARAQLT